MAITNKRGQAAGAAVLLVIIAGLLIGFVILLPPSERAELLDEDYGAVDSTTTDDTDLDDAVIEKNLLTVSPGRVDFLGHKEIEHPLPVVNIYTKTESKIIAEKNIVYAKKGAFSGEPSKFKFVVPYLENSDNLLLSFKVNEVNNK